MLSYLKENPSTVHHYQVIVIHVGTNWLSTKIEFGLYLQFINDIITKESYEQQITSLNPAPANGPATVFKDTIKEIIHLIKSQNQLAKILVSAIIPRSWDHDRRNLVRISYNNLLKNLAREENSYFIETYSPFFDGNKNLKSQLFSYDGLHLSPAGSWVLKTFLCDKIARALKNKLVM